MDQTMTMANHNGEYSLKFCKKATHAVSEGLIGLTKNIM